MPSTKSLSATTVDEAAAGGYITCAPTRADVRGIGLRLALLVLLGMLLVLLLRWESSLLLRLAVALILLYGGAVVVTQLRRFWTTQRAYQLAMEAAHDGFWEWDPVTKRLNVGKRLLQILGYNENFLPDTHAWLDLVHPDDRRHYNETVSQHLKGETPFFYCEYRVKTQQGDYCWIASRGIAVRNRRGVAYQMAGSVTDINARKLHEEQIAYLAEHDLLTGLPNRFMLAEKLGYAVAQSDAGEHCVALLFIDLDRFKDINDSLGHNLGDHLLQAVSERLERGLRQNDLLVRQGGDEFIVMLPGICSREAAEARAKIFLDQLDTPFEVDSNHLHVGASIGLSLYPDDAENAEQLLRNADTAMYAAKRQGGSKVCWHTPEMKERVLSRASMESRLRSAIEKQAFQLHYQPQFDTATGRLLGAEALLRWQDEGAWIGPDRFVPVAEDTGLIVPIGDWVLEQAIACLAGWPEQLRMAINLSPRQFWSGDLVGRIDAICTRHGVPPACIELEVTESMLLQAEGAHVEMLHELRKRGFLLALDDFGTGYSSLSYLHRLPFSALKIDRSFVMAMTESDGRGPTLVPTIIAMAHSLGLEVVAEGVETAGQLEQLRALHCNVHQGYFSGRPVAEDNFRQRFLSGNA